MTPGGGRGGRRRGGRGRNRGGRGRGEKLPKVQRVAAYAVILRETGDRCEILLSRLAKRISEEPLWTLPGGGLEHGEDPRKAVVREVYEEAGVPVEVGETSQVYSVHQPRAWRMGRKVDSHALRIVYEGLVPPDAPEPHTTEVGGSTEEAAWIPLEDVQSGEIRTVALVREALAAHRPQRHQRVAAYAWITRDDDVLLTRISERGYHVGWWTLPGGGIDFGEEPREALQREVREECGVDCTVGDALDVDDISVTGNAPSGRYEEYHGVHLIFAATVDADAEVTVAESDGTTDAVEWVPIASLDGDAGERQVLDVVRAGLSASSRRG